MIIRFPLMPSRGIQATEETLTELFEYLRTKFTGDSRRRFEEMVAAFGQDATNHLYDMDHPHSIHLQQGPPNW